jgi:hypothetical protein
VVHVLARAGDEEFLVFAVAKHDAIRGVEKHESFRGRLARSTSSLALASSACVRLRAVTSV